MKHTAANKLWVMCEIQKDKILDGRVALLRFMAWHASVISDLGEG